MNDNDKYTVNNASSILAVHPGALGDVILFGHLLHRLGGSVTLVAGGEKARLLAGLGVVARPLDYDALPMHEIFSDTPLEACRLPALWRSHERLVSCFADSNPMAQQRLMALSGASSAAFLPIRPGEAPMHLTDLWTEQLGLPPVEIAPPAWAVPEAWRDAARKSMGRIDILLHPGAGAAGKCWPLEHYVELADSLTRSGRAVTFILGPVEQERFSPADRQRLAACGTVLDTPLLATLAGALAEANVFIGNDSGPAHLSAAVGTPTFALFGPTRAEQFAPLGPNVTAIFAPSLAELPVIRVTAAINALKND